MKHTQLSFPSLSSLPSCRSTYRREHGGTLSLGKRRSRRPLSLKAPLHVTLRSELATSERSLLRHRPLIEKIVLKAAKSFHIRIYEKAICGNHIHLLIKGRRRADLQNFFRVISGHIAQEILRKYPLPPSRGGARKGHAKNQRKFWSLLLYSRILTWGKEYKLVKAYVIQNTLEALNLTAYRPRGRKALNKAKDLTANRKFKNTS
jgi:REP element-mobilizing transposase RayT